MRDRRLEQRDLFELHNKRLAFLHRFIVHGEPGALYVSVGLRPFQPVSENDLQSAGWYPDEVVQSIRERGNEETAFLFYDEGQDCLEYGWIVSGWEDGKILGEAYFIPGNRQLTVLVDGPFLPGQSWKKFLSYPTYSEPTKETNIRVGRLENPKGWKPLTMGEDTYSFFRLLMNYPLDPDGFFFKLSDWANSLP